MTPMVAVSVRTSKRPPAPCAAPGSALAAASRSGKKTVARIRRMVAPCWMRLILAEAATGVKPRALTTPERGRRVRALERPSAGEGGANPPRSRHCDRLRFLNHRPDASGWEGPARAGSAYPVPRFRDRGAARQETRLGRRWALFARESVANVASTSRGER